jgi:hypothetical protein
MDKVKLWELRSGQKKRLLEERQERSQQGKGERRE